MKSILCLTLVMSFTSSAFADVEVICDGVAGVPATTATGAAINARIQELQKAGKKVVITALTSSAALGVSNNSEGQTNSVCAALSY
jgi:hypothetical protein